MIDREHVIERLKEIAPRLDALPRFRVLSGIRYDMWADALWWTDEIPAEMDAGYHWALWPLLRYRTSLILGDPDDELKEFWEAGRRLFPNWPGFESRRCRPNSRLADLYRRWAHDKGEGDGTEPSSGDVPSAGETGSRGGTDQGEAGSAGVSS